MRVAQSPPTLEDFRKMWVENPPDTDTLYYVLHEVWDGKRVFAHVLSSLKSAKELIVVLPDGAFDVEIRLYSLLVGSARFEKMPVDFRLVRLRKGREVVEQWARWCGLRIQS